MNIRPHTFVRIIYLMFSWKCGKVSGSDTTMKTWKQAVLDCYGNNSFLESNTTVLQKYMLNDTKVNDSIWVGSFEALLPWIEIRGCYNIPLTCSSFERDETNAANLQLCQIKCMNRRYFAFNQKNERCVCFDKHNIVKKDTDNASYCQEFIDRGDNNTHAVVYKVFDGPLTLAGYNHDCLSYQCNSNGSKLTFTTKECYTYSRSYCRDGRRAVGPVPQNFPQYRGICEENHFTYPLLYSEDVVKLCIVPESLTPGTDVWVGVYRQKLYIDNLDKAVLQDFDQIEQYISRCDHLPTDAVLKKAENCSEEHHYLCTSDTQIDIQEEPINNTSTQCQSEDPYTGNADNQSSGIIAGTVTSILVIGVIVAIVVFTCRRLNCKSPIHKDNRNAGDPPKNNIYTQENNSEGHHNAFDMTLSSNTFAKPPAAHISRVYVQKAAEDENEYAIANPGYNDFQVKVDSKNTQNGDQQGSHFLANNIKSEEYCLAKPLTDTYEMNYHTDSADYDHLGSVKHKEKDNVNVYDHVPNIIDSDDTYDHSAINICKSDTNNYDHFDVQN